MRKVVYTEDAIKVHLEDNVVLTKFERDGVENFQVKVADLKNTVDDKKADILMEARNKLREAGYNASFQFSHKAKNEDRWIPFPCVWINQEERKPVREAVREANQNSQLMLKSLKKIAKKLDIDISEELAEMASLGAGDQDEHVETQAGDGPQQGGSDAEVPTF